MRCEWVIKSAVLMPKNGCPSKMFYRKSELKPNTVKKGKDRPFLGEVFVSLLIYLDATRFVSPTVM